MKKTETIKTLKLEESKVSEPVIVPISLVEKYIKDDKIVVNGVITYLVKTCSENFYDSDAIKSAITECLKHLQENEGMDLTRVSIDGTHIIEAKKISNNYIFDYIKVTPEYV